MIEHVDRPAAQPADWEQVQMGTQHRQEDQPQTERSASRQNLAQSRCKVGAESDHDSIGHDFGH